MTSSAAFILRRLLSLMRRYHPFDPIIAITISLIKSRTFQPANRVSNLWTQSAYLSINFVNFLTKGRFEVGCGLVDAYPSATTEYSVSMYAPDSVIEMSAGPRRGWTAIPRKIEDRGVFGFTDAKLSSDAAAKPPSSSVRNHVNEARRSHGQSTACRRARVTSGTPRFESRVTLEFVSCRGIREHLLLFVSVRAIALLVIPGKQNDTEGGVSNPFF